MLYVTGRPSPCNSGKKDTVTTKLAIQFVAPATASAALRKRLGNISPSSTQTTGPHDMPNATIYRFAAISPVHAWEDVNNGRPSSPGLAEAKVNARTAIVSAIPTEPTTSSGLRPI